MRVLFGSLAFCIIFVSGCFLYFGFYEIFLGSDPFEHDGSDMIILWLALSISLILSAYGALVWRYEPFFQVFFFIGLGLLLISFFGWQIERTKIVHDDDVYRLLEYGSPENFVALQNIVSINFAMIAGVVCIVLAICSDHLKSTSLNARI